MIPKCGNRGNRIWSDSHSFLENDVEAGRKAGGKKGGRVDVKYEVPGQDSDLRYYRMQQKM